MAELKRRVLALPVPRSAPPGPLEGAAWVLLHRSMPFEPDLRVVFASRWGLATPEKAFVVPSGRQWGPRRSGAAFQLRRLVDTCAPPVCLKLALDLLRDAPWLSEDAYSTALRLAGLSDGTAGLDLVLALSELWPARADGGEPGSENVVAPGELGVGEQELLGDLAQRVRELGAVPAPAPMRAVAGRWLRRERNVVWRDGWAVRFNDSTSALAHPVRRQLAAAGPLDAAELLRGAVRAVPKLVALDPGAVRVWARAQDDLRVGADGLVHLTRYERQWLRPSDQVVLALARDPAATGDISTAGMVSKLVEHGLTQGSAQVFVVRCPWLRSTGVRGRYRVAAR